MEVVISAVILVFYALGGVLLRLGWRDICHGVGARRWPTAPAQWKTCVLEHHVTDRGQFYRVRVAYQYRVAGSLYSGDNVAIGYVGTNAREVHAGLHARLVGMRPFVVRYLPGQPEVSTILPSENALVYGTFVFGLCWVALTTVSLWVVLGFSGYGVPFVEGLSQWMDSLTGR